MMIVKWQAYFLSWTQRKETCFWKAPERAEQSHKCKSHSGINRISVTKDNAQTSRHWEAIEKLTVEDYFQAHLYKQSWKSLKGQRNS